ncbi:hypothetical protein [Flavobacterium sp.]|nr:hypothetical protein [Flavobacterium sp.]
MKTRTLGNSGLDVSAFGISCIGHSFGHDPKKDKKSNNFFN